MSDDLNPYAPPPIIAEQAHRAWEHSKEGLWRDGKLLVLHKSAKLPGRCVKSNEPTDRFLKRKLVWYPPWIALTILLAWPVFLILALVMQKRAQVDIGLTPEWIGRRRMRIATAWGLVLLGFFTFFGAIAWAADADWFGLVLAGGVLMGFVGIIYGSVGARMVYPTKIDDQFVWLKGVCREFLDELPPWPGKR
jgi:hypothetical protein